MNTEIENLNKYLQSKNRCREYYDSLIDIHKKSRFFIGSGDFLFDNPLKTYLKNHKHEYIILFGTGSCEYVKL